MEKLPEDDIVAVSTIEGFKMPQPDADNGRDQIRILLVDDQSIVRQAIKQLLDREPDMRICSEATDPQSSIEAIELHQPNMVLLDLALKTGDGLSLTRAIHARFPLLPILMLSLHSEVLFAERALRAGACGYIMKSAEPDALLSAIRQVALGGIYISDEMRQRILQRLRGAGGAGRPIQELSNRELEVFHLIGQGYTTRQIAELLSLSSKTIESHRSQIKKKLEIFSDNTLDQTATQWVSEHFVM